MAAIGEILREARQSKGLSLSELEEITKIRTHYLKALEDENFDELPGKTYVKGFLGTYARALGLDPKAILTSFNVGEPQEKVLDKPEAPLRPRSRSRRVVPRWLTISVLCILAVITLFGVNSIGTKHPAQSVSPPAQPKTAANKPLNRQLATKPPTKQSVPPQSKPATPAQGTAQNVAPSVGSNPAQLSLVIKFTADCWLLYKTDNQQAVQGSFTSGTTKVITAQNNITFVTVGSAGAMQLTLNGTPLRSLGGLGKVVNNIVFTRSDIGQ